MPELRRVPKHPTWILELPADPDELRASWKKTSNNLFRNLRKADKAGVSVREGRDESDLRAFYALYLRTMRRRRSLPRPYRQLSEDRRLLQPDGTFRLFVAEHEGDIVAGGVFHAFGDTVDLLYNGSDDSRLDVRPNHALYWHAIRWAVESGHPAWTSATPAPTRRWPASRRSGAPARCPSTATTTCPAPPRPSRRPRARAARCTAAAVRDRWSASGRACRSARPGWPAGSRTATCRAQRAPARASWRSITLPTSFTTACSPETLTWPRL